MAGPGRGVLPDGLGRDVLRPDRSPLHPQLPHRLHHPEPSRELGIHSVGQIWSQALWEIRLGYVARGLTTEAWDTTLISSQFDYAPDTTFQAAAKATYEEALARDGAAAARLVREKFAARGITF